MADEKELGGWPITEPKKKKKFGHGLVSEDEFVEVEGKATTVDVGPKTRKKNLTTSDDVLPESGANLIGGTS